MNLRYLQAVRQWHTPVAGKDPPIDAKGRPMLALVSVNTGDRIELQASTDEGGFSARELDRAAFVLREPSTGNQHPVEPRTLNIIYQIQTHCRAQEVRVVSGYRSLRGESSNHAKGRAIDFIVPGTSDKAVTEYARALGFVGVGIYPISGFVHIDVRSRSYFWVDASGPGRPNRERGILPELALKSDASARGRGAGGVAPFFIATNVDAFLRGEIPPPDTRAPDEEDEDGEGNPPDEQAENGGVPELRLE